jgi:hypothetical protein
VTILFNGKVGARQHRLLIFIIDGQMLAYRPYVGYYLMLGEIEHE